MMKPLKDYCAALIDENLMPTALKVAAMVGSLLFLINHGSAVVQGKMTRDRWISGLLTYLVPYGVNIHGQYINRSRKR
jgi:hypothetical protein